MLLNFLAKAKDPGLAILEVDPESCDNGRFIIFGISCP